jgi:cytochrome oxidase Cu insertion factor (SCO1/SenC/PrrC family)
MARLHTAAFLVFGLGCVALPGCSATPSTFPDIHTLPDFSLTECNGQKVHRDDLRGKVWAASFIFTRCGGACPQVTHTMARLQQELANEPDFRLVTVTVDPEHDTPELLRAYAKAQGADPARWFFLTGEQGPLYDLVKHGFLLGVEQNQGSARTPGNEVLHSTKIVVVDRAGHIRGLFEGRQLDDERQPVDAVPRLKEAILSLLRDKS